MVDVDNTKNTCDSSNEPLRAELQTNAADQVSSRLEPSHSNGTALHPPLPGLRKGSSSLPSCSTRPTAGCAAQHNRIFVVPALANLPCLLNCLQ